MKKDLMKKIVDTVCVRTEKKNQIEVTAELCMALQMTIPMVK